MISRIAGWGNTPHSFSKLVKLTLFDETELNLHSRGAIPRGLGRSYGDSANNSGGVAIDTANLKGIDIDPEKGIAVIGSGVSIFELEVESLKHGFFPFVVPGTAQVTIGGAIASDIHGKSHHKIGSFSNHLLEMKLLTSDGVIKTLRPNDGSSHIFWATVGGMGLTGVIIEATISLMRVESEFVTVEEKRVMDLDELLITLLKFNSSYMYTVAWIDLSGKFQGRGIVSGANHSTSESRRQNSNAFSLKPLERVSFKIPYPFKFGIINDISTRIFNSFWYHKPLGKKLQHVQKYMHPLDNVSNWNTVYGSRGFIQYQFVVPLDNTQVLKHILSKLKITNSGSFLTVLKSFGEESSGLISFPIKGWSLAIDFPKNIPNLSQVLRDLDQLVLSAGGRVYLTKDSRLSHIHIPLMYPNLHSWKKIKGEIDPNNHWQSDQGRRLKLC
jgi:decaprenylphospho-beta-D-ribofuranose 2-oxidase